MDEGVNAAFMRNHRGAVCIAFSDPSYVRAAPAQQGVSTGSGAAITTVYRPGQNVPL